MLVLIVGYMFNINKVPMVRVTWVDARDTETGWLDIKEVIDAPLAVCQEVGWMVYRRQMGRRSD